MGAFHIYFDRSSTHEGAGRRAMPDVADALGLVVEVVDRWNDETCTPLPGCDEEAASVCSVEDVLHQFALESRCRRANEGWQPIPGGELRVDVDELDQMVQREAGKLGGSARPSNKPLREWLQQGIPQQTTTGHRPFFDRAFKDRLLGEARDRDAAKLLVHEAVSRILSFVRAHIHVGRPDAMTAAKHRAARLRACLVEEMRHRTLNRKSAPSILRDAWTEACSPEVATDGGKIVVRISIKRMGRTVRFEVVDVKEYFDLLRGRGQPVPESWRAGFSVEYDGPTDSLRQAKDRLAALQIFLLHEDDVEFLENVT